MVKRLLILSNADITKKLLEEPEPLVKGEVLHFLKGLMKQPTVI